METTFPTATESAEHSVAVEVRPQYEGRNASPARFASSWRCRTCCSSAARSP